VQSVFIKCHERNPSWATLIPSTPSLPATLRFIILLSSYLPYISEAASSTHVLDKKNIFIYVSSIYINKLQKYFPNKSNNLLQNTPHALNVWILTSLDIWSWQLSSFRERKYKNTVDFKVISHVTLKIDLQFKVQPVTDRVPQLKQATFGLRGLEFGCWNLIKELHNKFYTTFNSTSHPCKVNPELFLTGANNVR